MGYSLSSILQEKGNGEITFDVTIDNKEVTTLPEYLRVLDGVTHICDEDTHLSKAYMQKLTTGLLKKYQEHLRETQSDWYGKFNPRLYAVAKQLESFAFLTGEQEAIKAILDEFPLLKEIKCKYESYESPHNFLHQHSEEGSPSPLKFKNFDRNLLALQMMIRVLDPSYINQREEQVCGVNAFVHNIALFNPLKYVRIVSELATRGECDLKEFSGKEGLLRIKVSEEVANKKSSDGSEIHDVDHVILNGIRSSENSIVRYSSEGAEFAKQLFGVTTHHEVNRWMKQAGYYHVQNIPIHEREAIKQLQLLIQDGYMVGFAGTGSLAAYILDPEQGAPASKNVVQRFMDGHFFIIRDIKFDEEKDMVDVRIMTWGEEKSASIPFDAWKKNIGLVGTAVVGQDPYMSYMFRVKARQMYDIQRSTYCSPEAYCIFVRNIIDHSPQYKEIHKLLRQVFNHENGLTWLHAAKEIQDRIEELRAREDEKVLMIPEKISIIPALPPEIKAKFDLIHEISERTKKINALEDLGIQDNIEVQRQLIPLYAQEGQWEKVRNLFAGLNKFSQTDKEIMYECLDQGCRLALSLAVAIPDDIQKMVDPNQKLAFKAKELIDALSKVTGLPKGGNFTYGLRGRLLECIRSRYQEEQREMPYLDNVILYKKDIYNLIALLNKELHIHDPSHRIMNQEKIIRFGSALVEHIEKKEQTEVIDNFPDANLKHNHSKTWKKICEFFLKVASYFDQNIINKRIEKNKNFKEDLGEIKEDIDLNYEESGMALKNG